MKIGSPDKPEFPELPDIDQAIIQLAQQKIGEHWPGTEIGIRDEDEESECGNWMFEGWVFSGRGSNAEEATNNMIAQLDDFLSMRKVAPELVFWRHLPEVFSERQAFTRELVYSAICRLSMAYGKVRN